MREVLDAVFGTTFGEDANPFVSRYAKTFGAIHESFAERADRFQRVLALQAVETPRGEYVEARCKWEKAVMLVRLTFDDQEQVTGFWLARDRDGPTPKGFRRGGYVVGEPMLKLAGYDLAIRSATAANGKDVLEQILVDENGTERVAP